MTELEIRNLEVRKVNQEARSITGLAVTWADIADIGGYKERFERGSISNVEGVKLFDSHKEPIGRVVRGVETEDGYEIEAVISKTARGNDVYEMLKDGTLDRFSVGFIPKESREDGDVLVRTAVDLKEVSVVPFPAYAGAQISEVRSDSNTNQTKEVNDETSLTDNQMDNNNTNDLVTRSDFESLERAIDLMKEDRTEEPKAQFRASGGELLKALAKGDDDAKQEMRAFTGATTGDSIAQAAWVARGLELVKVNRRAFDLFTHKQLPVSGNTIEYPLVSSVSGSVARQVAEGDDLTYSEVVLTTATAPVHTYGGYTSLSRQAIERSDVSYLETSLDHLARNYGRATNTAVLNAATGAAGVNTGTGFTLSTSDSAKWQTFVHEGVASIDDNGFGASAEFMWVSRDVFYKIASLTDSNGRPLLDVNNDGSNTIGSVNARGISGSILGMPLVVDAGLAAKTAFIGAKEAVEVYENSGAPYALSDDNIINLTKDFSLYGYMAIAVPNPKALFKVAVA